MAKIFVTGAFGLLGCSLVPYLEMRGHSVVRHDRGGRGDVQVDLTDISGVKSVLDSVLPEVIINLAALTNVDECERCPQKAYLANVKIVENLAFWIERSPGADCRLVQISTDQVYDGPNLHREQDVTLTNYYGFSKYAGELVALRANGVVLRTNFFGASRCVDRKSFSDWLLASLTQHNPIEVFDDIWFSPLTLRHLVEFIERVVVNFRSGVYNLGSKSSMSKADFAYAFANSLELSPENMKRGLSTNGQLLAFRPKNMGMDSSLFENTFEVSLPTLQEEIETMKDEYLHEA